MNDKKWITAVIVLLATIAFVAGSSGKGDLRIRLRAAQNEHALADSLKVVYQDESTTMSERLAVVQDSEKQLRSIMEDRVPAMARRIAELEGTESALIEARATIDSIVATGTAVDTVIIGPDSTKVYQVSFNHRQPGVNIDVVTRTPPPIYELKVVFDPIDLTIGIFELPTGQVGVDVLTPSWVTLGSLITNVNLPEPTWLEKHDFKIGVGLGVVGVLVILLAAGG